MREHKTRGGDGEMCVRVSSRTVVLFVFVNERAHAVVPQLDDTSVQACQHPWALGMKRESCQAGTESEEPMT
jgi:hypothetical protein